MLMSDVSYILPLRIRKFGGAEPVLLPQQAVALQPGSPVWERFYLYIYVYKHIMRDGLVGGPGYAWFEPVCVCIQETGCFLTSPSDRIKTKPNHWCVLVGWFFCNPTSLLSPWCELRI